MTVSDTMPINWHPEWPGVCDGQKWNDKKGEYEPCETEVLFLMCEIDDDTHAILRYDTWAQCPWCGKNWTVRIPNDND